MPNYTYVCDEEHRTEAKGRYEESSAPCATCGAPARRLAFYDPPAVSSPSGRLDPSHDSSQERFLDRAPYVSHAYEKAEQEVGGYLKRPDWFNAGIARSRTRAIQAKNDKQLREVTDLAKQTDANRRH